MFRRKKKGEERNLLVKDLLNDLERESSAKDRIQEFLHKIDKPLKFQQSPRDTGSDGWMATSSFMPSSAMIIPTSAGSFAYPFQTHTYQTHTADSDAYWGVSPLETHRQSHLATETEREQTIERIRARAIRNAMNAALSIEEADRLETTHRLVATRLAPNSPLTAVVEDIWREANTARGFYTLLFPAFNLRVTFQFASSWNGVPPKELIVGDTIQVNLVDNR